MTSDYGNIGQYPTAQQWKQGYPSLDETMASTVAMNTTSEDLG